MRHEARALLFRLIVSLRPRRGVTEGGLRRQGSEPGGGRRLEWSRQWRGHRRHALAQADPGVAHSLPGWPAIGFECRHERDEHFVGAFQFLLRRLGPKPHPLRKPDELVSRRLKKLADK